MPSNAVADRYGRVDCRTDTVGLPLRYQWVPATLLLTPALQWGVGGRRLHSSPTSSQPPRLPPCSARGQFDNNYPELLTADFCQARQINQNSAVVSSTKASDAHLPASTTTTTTETAMCRQQIDKSHSLSLCLCVSQPVINVQCSL